MGENSLKLHGKGQIFGMLRLALIPAAPGLALSMTSLKHFGKLKHINAAASASAIFQSRDGKF